MGKAVAEVGHSKNSGAGSEVCPSGAGEAEVSVFKEARLVRSSDRGDACVYIDRNNRDRVDRHRNLANRVGKRWVVRPMGEREVASVLDIVRLRFKVEQEIHHSVEDEIARCCVVTVDADQHTFVGSINCD